MTRNKHVLRARKGPKKLQDYSDHIADNAANYSLHRSIERDFRNGVIAVILIVIFLLAALVLYP